MVPLKIHVERARGKIAYIKLFSGLTCKSSCVVAGIPRRLETWETVFVQIHLWSNREVLRGTVLNRELSSEIAGCHSVAAWVQLRGSIQGGLHLRGELLERILTIRLCDPPV